MQKVPLTRVRTTPGRQTLQEGPKHFPDCRLILLAPLDLLPHTYAQNTYLEGLYSCLSHPCPKNGVKGVRVLFD